MAYRSSFCLLCIAILACLLQTPAPARAASNPIVLENQQPGSDGWRIGRTGYQVADDIAKQIKGFASATSVGAGQRISLRVTVNPVPQSYTIDFYRIGWYGGRGGRLMRHVGPLAGVRQPDCPIDARTGLLTCPWPASYSFWVPSAWLSGVYVAVLTNEQHYQNYVVFVVRDDARTADFLYQQPVLTYQAYNKYPDDGKTGKSLYPGRSWGPNTLAGTPQAVMVSFDRPYHNNGAGEFFFWEVDFIHWAERTGYDIAYSTSLDTHAAGGRLLGYKAWFSVGHDEYWTSQMYDAVKAARDAGVDLAFFGANDAYWQVRLAPSAGGVPRRVVVCYKDSRLDPAQTWAQKTIKWRDLGRPEQALIGIQFGTILSVADGGHPYVVVNAGSPSYSGTGFADGDSVPRIVGPETDRIYDKYPLPPNTSYTTLSRSPVVGNNGVAEYGNSSIYRAPSGAWVFAAGAWRWSWALDRQGYIDTRIQRTTTNILDRYFLGLSPYTTAGLLRPTGVYTTGTDMRGRVFAPDKTGEDDDEG